MADDEKIHFTVGKVQFLLTVGGILVAIVGFAFSLQADVRDAAKTADRAEAVAMQATAALNAINVRLERIQVTLEQLLKQHHDRITKLEAWRDGPQVRPEERDR